MMHPGNRTALFFISLLATIGTFIGTLVEVTDDTNRAAVPAAIVGGFGVLAFAVITAGTLHGMHAPQRHAQPPQAGYPQQGGYPQQFGRPGQPPQGGYAPPGGPQ